MGTGQSTLFSRGWQQATLSTTALRNRQGQAGAESAVHARTFFSSECSLNTRGASEYVRTCLALIALIEGNISLSIYHLTCTRAVFPLFAPPPRCGTRHVPPLGLRPSLKTKNRVCLLQTVIGKIHKNALILGFT